MTMSRATRSVLSIGGFLLIAVGTAACSQRSLNMAQPRPALADTLANYNEMLAALRELVSARGSSIPWVEEGEFEQTFGVAEGTVRVVSPLWIAEVHIAEDESARDAVIAQSAAVLAAHGFDRFSVVVEEPGHFSYVAGDSLGGEVHFSGMAATTMRYTTGAFDED